MVTLICATHRPQNQTTAVVNAYAQILKNRRVNFQKLDMAELPKDFPFYGAFGNSPDNFNALVEEKINNAAQFIVIAPEYNGSFPGIFKTFLDIVPPKFWNGKNVALVGVASGRAGNLRGLDHLTNIFNYLKAEVYSNKIPVSGIDQLLDDKQTLLDQETLLLLEEQAKNFLK
tara:strand:- start:364 stop:882 length:519 start_codon:yes stop_codon:yes gene_type:complete